MLGKLLTASSALASIVAADSLSTYQGSACHGANQALVSPLGLGECIPFGSVGSYILTKDDGNTYNLFSGENCDQYEGQVALSGICTTLDADAPSRATHVMNVGPQSKKRASVKPKAIKKIRGTNPAFPRRDDVTFSRSGFPILKRVDGDVYQCPNTPYFFVVTSSSAVKVETTIDEDTQIESTFDAAFARAYEQGGQTTVQSESVGDQGETIRITLEFTQGTANFIAPEEADPLINGFNEFRDNQQSPGEFFVSIFTGTPDHPDNTGAFATFQWFIE
ncbi:hypothetical protein Slin14017_G122530 [Septoria linicola]|nr:hypothetical protein Slin14017_G122530 [Septoria linicola]